jgi:hypothetical protein
VFTIAYIELTGAASVWVVPVSVLNVSPVPVVAVFILAEASAAPVWLLRTETRLWLGNASVFTGFAVVSAIRVTSRSRWLPVTFSVTSIATLP